MHRRRVSRFRVGMVAGVTALAVFVQSLPNEALTATAGGPPPLPYGASTVAPAQHNGSAEQPPSVSGSPVGPTVAPPAASRPAGAVPDAQRPPEVDRPLPERHRLAKLPLRMVGGSGTFDERSRREVRAEWTADSRVYRDAKGATSRRLFPGRVNVQGADGAWAPMAADTQDAAADDTYVTTGSSADRSAEQRLQIGKKPNSGTSASFLHFPGLTSGAMRNQYIRGLTLNLHSIEVPSCTPKPVDVFAVARPWTGSEVKSWPGVALGRHLGQASFAYGIPGSCDTNWGHIPLQPDLATDWTHGVPFNGLAVRAANEGDTGAWKAFASANTPVAVGKPYLDLLYSPHGASYRADEVTLPTNTLPGQLKATVWNRGSVTWTPAGPHKFGVIIRGTSHVGKHAVPRDVAPGQSVQMVVALPPLTPNVTYQVDLTMFDGTADYQPTYGVPYGRFPLQIVNVPPSVVHEQPASGAAVDSIRPTLYAEGTDTDRWPNTGLKYNYKICAGTPDSPVDCQQSGWTGATWTPPSALKWSRSYFWWVQAHDNVKAGPFAGPLQLHTQVPQPQITSHIGGTPAGAPAPGLDPQVGNFGLTTTDASVATVGPDLTVARTYNSLDPRTDTAFGQGWSSRLDTQLAEDADSSGNVVVTLPTGRQVRFGKNADGSYAPPQGQNLTLVHQPATGYYTLRDATATRWDFNAYGRLRAITDPSGLVEELEYDDAGPTGKPKSIHNLTSKRRLLLTWTGGRVTVVKTETPSTGEPALTWNYGYDGARLTSACNPGAAPNCTRYEYQTGSHYRSVVLDDNPRAYWRLGESSTAGGAGSATARKPDLDRGTYNGVGLSAAGALSGTADTAAAFGGSDGASRVVLPTKLTSPTMSLAVELWFKTGAGGVLMSYANQPFGTTPSSYAPLLYVGQDGLLRGGFWASASSGDRQIESSVPVNDNQWHHVVLSGSINQQELYLDGRKLPGTISGPIDHDNLQHLVLGAGYTKGWPSGNDGTFHFSGFIDEVALYQHPLGAAAVAQHHAARQAVVQLTKATTPQDDRVLAQVGYDDVNDRVSTLTDHDGRVWRLDVPSRDEAVRRVTLRGPYPDWAYEFDADHGGRLTARTHDGKKRAYKYNEAGFPAQQIDELGHAVTTTTDARGNVLSRSTCRTADSCQTAYSTYYLNSGDPLDPRNDRKTSDSDARSSGATDTTYRTSYTYDSVGRLLTTTAPKTSAQQTPTETWKYSTGAEPAAGGGTMPAGLLLEQTGKRPGQLTKYLYRATGDLAEQVDPVGLRTQYEYDGIGRRTVEKVLSAAGAEFRRSTTTYTARSEIDKVTGSPVKNSLDNLTSTPVTDYDYDANGNTVRVTESSVEAAGTPRATQYQYDPQDRLVLTRFADGTEERKDYRDAGREIRTTDPAGTVWIEYYDSQSRLLRRVAAGPGVDPADPDATLLPLEVNNYDAAGRLISSRDANGRETVRTYYGDDLPDTVSLSGVRQAKYDYDAAGNVLKETAAGGRVTTSTYDPAGYLVTNVLDPDGLKRTSTYVRSADGAVTRRTQTGAVQPNRSETVDYVHDAAGRLVRESVSPTQGDVLSIDYARDERGLVLTTTDRRRLTTDYTYDGYDRLVSQTLPEVTTWVGGAQQTGVRPRTTIGHNVFGDVTHQRDANGAVTKVDHDALGRSVAVRRPTYTPPGGAAINAVDLTAYDALGNAVVMTDALGHRTTRKYDPHSRLIEETAPAVGDQPSTTRLRYNRNGELVASTDPSGATREWTYDERGRRTTETAVDRKPQLGYYVTEFEYDDADNQVLTRTPTDAVQRTTYNAAGEPLTVTDPTGKVTTSTYDLVGRPLTVKDPAGIVMETTYDVLGRDIATRQLSGNPLVERRRWQRSYDPNGNLIQQVTPEARTTTFGYDGADRMVRQDEQVASGKLIRTTFGFDATGNRTRQVDGKQQVTQFGFTAWGQPATTTEPGGVVWTASYDAAGREHRNDLPGGVVVSTEYDAQGRVVKQSGAGAEAATADKTFGYDAAGRLTSFGTPGGRTTVDYDDRGNPLAFSGPTGNATYSYTADSRIATRADVTGASTFGYDAAGRPKSVADGLSGRTIDYTYDAAGRLAASAERGMEGVVKRISSYDAVGRLAADKVTEPDPNGGVARIVHGTEYGYDLDDNVTSKATITNGQRTANTYGYDGAGRLTSWTAPTGTTPYEWDDAGNRTRAGSKTYTYNARNQLVSDGTTTFTYTPRGTLAASGGRSLAFDAFDQLVSDGTSYSYDSLGRVATRGQTPLTYNGYGNDVLSDGARLISRGPGGEPLADKATGSSASAKLLYADQHGDVTARYLGLDTYGQRTYDPFGKPLAAAGEQPSLGYQGEWTDPASGAVNMQSRWYAPDTGSFVSRDTWTNPPAPSIAGNRYTYGNGSPMVNADPTGHFIPLIAALLVAVIGMAVRWAVMRAAAWLVTRVGFWALSAASTGIATCTMQPHACAKGITDVWKKITTRHVAGSPRPDPEVMMRRSVQSLINAVLTAQRRAMWARLGRDARYSAGFFMTFGRLGGFLGSGGRRYLPPPPPPPLWVQNLLKPPPRPAAGSTVVPRPAWVDVSQGLRVIDRSDELADEATVTTQALPDAVSLSGGLGAAPLPPEEPAATDTPAAEDAGPPQPAEIGPKLARPGQGDAFPDPYRLIPRLADAAGSGGSDR